MFIGHNTGHAISFLREWFTIGLLNRAEFHVHYKINEKPNRIRYTKGGLDTTLNYIKR